MRTPTRLSHPSVHNNDYRRASGMAERGEGEQDRVFLARFARLKTGMADRKRHRFSAFWLRSSVVSVLISLIHLVS